MNLVTAEHLTKSYTERLLFDDTDFSINEGDKIGLIGINGTGKSTLLKLVAGLEEPDSGRIVRGRNLDIRYLPQNPVFHPGETVLESVLRENEGHEHVWDIESQAKSMLNRLGIPDFNEKVEHLSGGQKKRAALASVLLSTAELLILDEPTNHLDIHSREALENALASYGGTLLIVSHDRYLINKLADRIVWLGKTGTVNIDGNYDRYIELKEAKAQSEQAVQVKAAEGKKNDYKERKERESTLRKLSGALKRCEQAIDEVGLKTAELAQQMSQPEIATDYEKTSALAQEIEALKEKEEALTVEWMELSEQIEAFT